MSGFPPAPGLRGGGRVAGGLGVGTRSEPRFSPQQSSNSKKDKDALEDRKRNPLLRYIGKPRSSSQNSESAGLAGPQGRATAPAQPSSGGAAPVVAGGRALLTAGAPDLRVGLCAEGLRVRIEVFRGARSGAQRPRRWSWGCARGRGALLVSPGFGRDLVLRPGVTFVLTLGSTLHGSLSFLFVSL